MTVWMEVRPKLVCGRRSGVCGLRRGEITWCPGFIRSNECEEKKIEQGSEGPEGVVKRAKKMVEWTV